MLPPLSRAMERGNTSHPTFPGGCVTVGVIMTKVIILQSCEKITCRGVGVGVGTRGDVEKHCQAAENVSYHTVTGSRPSAFRSLSAATDKRMG